MKHEYPKTEIRPFEELLNGKRMVDNYRWLETTSDERSTWIDEQNKLADSFILDDPKREIFAERFDQLLNYDRTGFPLATLSRIFYSRIKRDEKHASLYMRDWPDGDEHILVDIDRFSEQGNISLGAYRPTRDGSLLAYGLSKDGSDWLHWYIMDIETGDIIDEIPRLVYTSVSWLPDKSGFFYCRSMHSDPEELKKIGMKVFCHKLGTDWRNDEMIFGDELTESDLPYVWEISKDGHHLIIFVDHGLTQNELFYADLSKPELKIESITANHDGLFYPDIEENVLYVVTNNKAPKYRLCRFSLDGTLPNIDRWETIIDEGDDVLSSFTVIGGRLFVDRSVDVIQHTSIHSLDGRKIGKLEYPGVGKGSLPHGEDEVDAVFVSYSSFFEPPVMYRYDIRSNKLSVFIKSSLTVNTEDYITEQVFYRSFDGTAVPMFVIRSKDTPLDGSNPTILTGYGGFEHSLKPSFSSRILFWLEHGGIYVIANIRGGGEYGENWHLDGMLGKKQNVFDDFIAAGEALIGERPVRLSNEDNFAIRQYSSREHIGIMGSSNGGLLTGAALVQRPDLWAAVISNVPLLDMLRFHLTEGGKYWISEYGNPDNSEHFNWLIEYSPYHNVKNGSHFPPTLIITSLHDDRGTDSMHAFKMTAKLQACNTSDKPIILRTLTNVGHGAGRTTQMSIAEQTEICIFMLKHLSYDFNDEVDGFI